MLDVRAMKCNRLVIHWVRTHVFDKIINITTFLNYGRYHNNQYLIDIRTQNIEHTIDAGRFVRLHIGDCDQYWFVNFVCCFTIHSSFAQFSHLFIVNQSFIELENLPNLNKFKWKYCNELKLQCKNLRFYSLFK